MNLCERYVREIGDLFQERFSDSLQTGRNVTSEACTARAIPAKFQLVQVPKCQASLKQGLRKDW
jgi:hypothetical protein